MARPMASLVDVSIGKGDKVALFGRFRELPKKRLEGILAEQGAKPLRDLTRASTHLVVGEAALSAFDALSDRLEIAGKRGLPILGERRLLRLLSGNDNAPPAVVPVESAAGLSPDLLSLLGAFDLITLENAHVSFRDAAVLKNADSLERNGMAWPDILRALLDQRESPKGRHRIVAGPDGTAMLEWDDGVTTLSGQHVLPLEDGDALDDVFERALEAENTGDLALAARLFETCAQMNRKDALASFNLGNVRRTLGDLPGARLAFQQAIGRDRRFAEAHFNLADILEAEGDLAQAKSSLRQATKIDKTYADALFNLAQLELADENWLEAKVLFERTLASGAAGALEPKAEKGLRLISLARSRR